jgi:choline-glycine betaine transporter
MAFIITVILIGLVLVGMFKFVTSRDSRAETIKEFKADPLVSIFVSIWILMIFCFFFGVFIPPFGELRLKMLGGLEIWKLGGLGSLSGFLIFLFASKRFL